MTPSLGPPTPPLRLRPATLADAGLLLDWRNDPGTRAASHSPEPIALADHVAWLERVLADPDRRLWIACAGARPVGTVRADQGSAPDGRPLTTLSWTVAPQARGQGWGRPMVALAAAQCSGRLRAEVKRGNTASARIAEAIGLVLVAEHGDTLHYASPAG